MSSSASSSSSSSTQQRDPVKDLDCAYLARDALFPLKIQRDGTHPTQFPASEALSRVRDASIRHDPDRAESSFYPRGIMVIHDISNPDVLKWNGQPDLSRTDASMDIIPKILSVKCRPCDSSIAGDAYYKKTPAGTTESSGITTSDINNLHREIVLCSNRLLKKDYKPTDLPPPNAPKSLAAIETALAHQITKIAIELDREWNGTTNKTAEGVADMEVQAAKAAECYYSSKGGEIKRGPVLGHYGYSLYPSFIQGYLRDRCIRAVATKAMSQTLQCNTNEAKQYIDTAISDAK